MSKSLGWVPVKQIIACATLSFISLTGTAMNAVATTLNYLPYLNSSFEVYDFGAPINGYSDNGGSTLVLGSSNYQKNLDFDLGSLVSPDGTVAPETTIYPFYLGFDLNTVGFSSGMDITATLYSDSLVSTGGHHFGVIDTFGHVVGFNISQNEVKPSSIITQNDTNFALIFSDLAPGLYTLQFSGSLAPDSVGGIFTGAYTILAAQTPQAPLPGSIGMFGSALLGLIALNFRGKRHGRVD